MNSISIRGAFLALSVLFAVQASGQTTQAIHQSFEIDSVTQIQLELFGEYEISYWEGNTILTETNIELSDASPNILKHFVKLGRYHLEMKSQPDAVHFTHRDPLRKPIYTKNGQAWEFVKLMIYIPDVFSSSDDKLFTISEETAKAN